MFNQRIQNTVNVFDTNDKKRINNRNKLKDKNYDKFAYFKYYTKCIPKKLQQYKRPR
jgi:hypothetical protein